jgi:hypothetical protein
MLPNCDPAQNRCVRSHCGIGTNQRGFERRAGFLDVSTRIRIIRKDAVGTQENVVFDRYSAPNCDSIFDRYIIAQYGASLDEGVIADIAAGANSRTRQDMREGPYPGTRANMLGLDQGLWMSEVRL